MTLHHVSVEQADAALERAQELVAAGQHQEALEELKTAIAGFSAGHEKFGLIIALKNESELKRDSLELEEALQSVKQAHDILAETKPEAAQVGDFATETGSIYAQMGWLDESESWYTAGAREYAAHGRIEEYAHNMICLAGIYRQRGDEATARAHLKSAISVLKDQETVNTEKLAEVYLDLAHSLMSEGELTEAEEQLNEASTYAAVTSAHHLLGEIFQGLAIVKAQQGNRAEANTCARRAVGAFETSGERDKAEFARQIVDRTA